MSENVPRKINFDAEFNRSRLRKIVFPSPGSAKALDFGFVFQVMVRLNADNHHISVYSWCCTCQESLHFWSAKVDFTVRLFFIDGNLNVAKTETDVVLNQVTSGFLGWGAFATLESLEKCVNNDKFMLSIEVILKDHQFGPPIFQKREISEVAFHRSISISDLSTDHWLWFFSDTSPIFQVMFKTDVTRNNLTWKVKASNSASQLVQMDNPVTITARSGSLAQSSVGCLNSSHSNLSLSGMAGTVTVSVRITGAHTQPSNAVSSVEETPADTGTPARIDFGRDKIDLAEHGNITFDLVDGTQLKLNSIILSYNSPILKKLMVNKNQFRIRELSAAVRIFADACYTGTLEKLDGSTEFSVFQDLTRMFAAFKMEWPEKRCLQFLTDTAEERMKTFSGFMEWVHLVHELSTKCKNHAYLEHFLGLIDKTKLKRFLLRALETSSNSEIDLAIVLTVEKELVSEFIFLLPSINGTNFVYIMENFNFRLLRSEELEDLLRDLEGKFNEMDLSTEELRGRILGENDQHVQTEDSAETTESNTVTLAALSRMHWRKNPSSTWPCKSKRAFSNKPRHLFDKPALDSEQPTGSANLATVLAPIQVKNETVDSDQPTGSANPTAILAPIQVKNETVDSEQPTSAVNLAAVLAPAQVRNETVLSEQPTGSANLAAVLAPVQVKNETVGSEQPTGSANLAAVLAPIQVKNETVDSEQPTGPANLAAVLAPIQVKNETVDFDQPTGSANLAAVLAPIQVKNENVEEEKENTCTRDLEREVQLNASKTVEAEPKRRKLLERACNP